MRKIALGLVAAGALVATAAAPAMAQGFGFRIAGPGYYADPYYGYYNYTPGMAYLGTPYYGYNNGYSNYYDSSSSYPPGWGWDGYQWNYYGPRY